MTWKRKRLMTQAEAEPVILARSRPKEGVSIFQLTRFRIDDTCRWHLSYLTFFVLPRTQSLIEAVIKWFESQDSCSLFWTTCSLFSVRERMREENEIPWWGSESRKWDWPSAPFPPLLLHHGISTGLVCQISNSHWTFSKIHRKDLPCAVVTRLS